MGKFAGKTNVIFSLQGLTMLDEEKKFFTRTKPLGIILFGRNIKDSNQLKALCDDIKSCIGDNALILIDQEGGRVRRIKFDEGQDMKAPAHFISLRDKIGVDEANKLLYQQYDLCGSQLKKYGININCAPCADLRYSYADNVIGDRSFGDNLKVTIECCGIVQQALAKNSVQGIIKHIPGHGRAIVDSHLKLPVITDEIKDLENTDFAVFKSLKDAKMAMTAHIIYSEIDPENTITLSKKGLQYIREKIGFSGIIITDDLSMKALPGSPAENFRDAINAGCDIGLYCRGNLDTMVQFEKHLKPITKELEKKIESLDCFTKKSSNYLG